LLGDAGVIWPDKDDPGEDDPGEDDPGEDDAGSISGVGPHGYVLVLTDVAGRSLLVVPC
jgi:hypothetical protein